MFKSVYSLALGAFLCVLFVCSSASAAPEIQLTLKEKAPKTMSFVTLTQTASMEATGNWLGTGPTYTVTLRDLTTGTVVTSFNTTQTSWVFPNLTWKHLYNLSVGDTNILNDTELITY